MRGRGRKKGERAGDRREGARGGRRDSREFQWQTPFITYRNISEHIKR